jgi:hypothetical protein
LNWKENRIESAREGTNPMVIAEMKSGYAVMGDVQFFCLDIVFYFLIRRFSA